MEREAEPWVGVAISFELVESNFRSAPDAGEIAPRLLKDVRILGRLDAKVGGHAASLGQFPTAESNFYTKTSSRSLLRQNNRPAAIISVIRKTLVNASRIGRDR